MQPKPVFITGTDTGVGKTLVTALLYLHLRSRGHAVVAMKPFCSGSRSDALLLESLQPDSAESTRLRMDRVNPFYFPEPVAPLVAARKYRRTISIDNVLGCIEQATERFKAQSSKFKVHGSSSSSPRSRSPLLPRPARLLIEGAGGLLAPLGPGYSALEIIRRLECGCIVVSANRLGTLNHTLLTVQTLRAAGVQRVTVALSDGWKPGSVGQTGQRDRAFDPSRSSNFAILQELVSPVPVLKIPYLGPNPASIPALKKNAKKLRKTLARLFESCILCPRSL